MSTHFDISQSLIDKAGELAKQEGVLDRITFVKGAYARTIPNEVPMKCW